VETTSASRIVGRAAFGAACAGTVLGPIHALSRYATVPEDLESPLVRVWAEPATRALQPLLDWSDPDTVYLSYGKLWLFVIAAATAAAFAVRRQRTPSGLELWGWRIALPGYVLATVSSFGEYWTPWLDEAFMLLAIPAMLISVAGSTVLGIALLRRRFKPRATSWLLTAWFPAVVVLSTVISLGAAVLPMVWAWALAGHRAVSAPDDTTVDTRERVGR